jgi:hypothetical protein
MAYNRKHQSQELKGPFCQATGCFEKATFYLVLKETEEPNYYEMRDGISDLEIRRISSLDVQLSNESGLGFDGFKMIMYFCKRHENEFKYLIRGSELRVSKECRLRAARIRLIK